MVELWIHDLNHATKVLFDMIYLQNNSCNQNELWLYLKITPKFFCQFKNHCELHVHIFNLITKGLANSLYWSNIQSMLESEEGVVADEHGW
jgi:hypothetical protein